MSLVLVLFKLLFNAVCAALIPFPCVKIAAKSTARAADSLLVYNGTPYSGSAEIQSLYAGLPFRALEYTCVDAHPVPGALSTGGLPVGGVASGWVCVCVCVCVCVWFMEERGGRERARVSSYPPVQLFFISFRFWVCFQV